MRKNDDGRMVEQKAGVSLKELRAANTRTALATLAPDPWQAATHAKRAVADARLAVLGVAAQYVLDGASANSAAEALLAQLSLHMTPTQAAAIMQLDAKGRVPSLPTLKRWLGAYKKDGKAGLLPAHTGRQRVDYGWEARAVELYNLPSKPNAADVAYRLIAEGFEEVTGDRVLTYLKTLPATLGKLSPARVGKHLHQLTRQNHKERHMDDVQVGDIYAADGHTVDCYVAHPESGGLFRPELTVFLDLKSRHPVGWWVSESESTTTTLFALSNALTTHNHTPLFVYVDVGSGYKAKLMTDEVTGFYNKFNIEPIFALPGNPHGKGWIERFFLTLRNRHDKFFDDGQAYCGDDMAPETNRRLSVDFKSGRRKLRSLNDYVDSLKQFFNQYINTPMPKALSGATPAEVFAGLQRVELGMPLEAVARPSVTRMVTRQSVTLDKRRYFADVLALFDAKTVQVEYDLHDDAHVWISTVDGQFICVAEIVERIGVVSTSRLQDQKVKRLEGQIKRLDKHAEEKRARIAPTLDMSNYAASIEMADSTPDELPHLIDPVSDRARRIEQRTKNIIIDIDSD